MSEETQLPAVSISSARDVILLRVFNFGPKLQNLGTKLNNYSMIA